MKYRVVVHYGGAMAYDVEAESEDKAKDAASELFANEGYKAIAEGLEDANVCDIWESENED